MNYLYITPARLCFCFYLI